MAEAGQFSDFASRPSWMGLDDIEAEFHLGLPPTGFGDLHRAGMGSPRVGRPGDGRGPRRSGSRLFPRLSFGPPFLGDVRREGYRQVFDFDDRHRLHSSTS